MSLSADCRTGGQRFSCDQSQPRWRFGDAGCQPVSASGCGAFNRPERGFFPHDGHESGDRLLRTRDVDPLAPAYQRGGIDRHMVLKERLAAEVLDVGAVNPPRDNRFVREPEGVLKKQEPRHQPRRTCGPSKVRGKESGPIVLEKLPVDQHGQLQQLVAHFGNIHQAQEIILLGRAFLRLYDSTKTCRLS
jgi:hypothetical protein